MAVDPALASSVLSVLVGIVALAMAVTALQARRRTGNPQLYFVGAAFALFVVKSLFSAYMVQTHVLQHDDIELALSLFDLAIIVLLFLPIAVKARA